MTGKYLLGILAITDRGMDPLYNLRVLEVEFLIEFLLAVELLIVVFTAVCLAVNNFLVRDLRFALFAVISSLIFFFSDPSEIDAVALRIAIVRLISLIFFLIIETVFDCFFGAVVAVLNTFGAVVVDFIDVGVVVVITAVGDDVVVAVVVVVGVDEVAIELAAVGAVVRFFLSSALRFCAVFRISCRDAALVGPEVTLDLGTAVVIDFVLTHTGQHAPFFVFDWYPTPHASIAH